MFKNLNEPKVVNVLLDLLSNVSYGPLKISKSGAIFRNSFWDAAEIKNVEIPRPLVLPDFILIFKDYSTDKLDDYLIIAVESKWFKLKNINYKLREAYRYFGQPLRNYIYGFDSVVLLHLFEEDVEEDKIIEYTKTIEDAIKMLELPQVYLPMKLFSTRMFNIYQPVKTDYRDIRHVSRYLSRLCSAKRNPIFKNNMFKNIIIKRRDVLKVSLNLP